MSDNNKLDKKIRSLFDRTSESVNKEMASRKENVWASLEINEAAQIESPRKRKRKLGWLWFLLGMLLALGGMYLQQQLTRKSALKQPLVDAQATYISKNLASQLETFKRELSDIKYELGLKSTTIDSLKKSNLILHLALNDNSANQNSNTTSSIEYIRDTIYKTEIKERHVIVEKLVEKVIRDTVFIENAPLEVVPMVELEIVPDEKMTTSTEPVINPKCSRRSVQFNFK